jgi:hypothetical protein
MPTYTFKHKDTGEVTEKVMRISEHAAFVADHPEMEQVHLEPPILGDPVRLGITQPPADFQRGIIGRMRDRLPGATALHKTKFKIPREY